jgi:hypothetical protein
MTRPTHRTVCDAIWMHRYEKKPGGQVSVSRFGQLTRNSLGRFFCRPAFSSRLSADLTVTFCFMRLKQ